MMSYTNLLLIGLAAVAGGAVNALAGGGTLITFPALTAAGVPPVAASITNTVALCPGYLGATLAQAKDLGGQRSRLWMFVPAGVAGGVLGGILLLKTGEALFRALVPVLILLASLLIGLQERLRSWILKRAEHANASASGAWGAIPLGLAAVYGGYFGAGLSVIVLAVLGLVLEDSLIRLNALKQAIAFAVNVAAAVFFLFSGKIAWSAAIVMAVGALLGGVAGGRLAGKVHPSTLRWMVVSIGIVVACVYLVHYF